MKNNTEKRQLLVELLTQAEKTKNVNVFKSSSLGKPAYDLAKELDDHNGMAKAMYYIYIGSYYGKKENKCELLHEALQMISSDEEAFVVRFYNLLGLENMKRGYYSLAIDYFNKALEITQFYDDKSMLCMILNNTGEVFRKLGDYKRAVAYYTEAYEEGILAKSVDSENLCIYSLHNLIVAYSELKNTAKASYYLDELEKIQKHIKGEFKQSLHVFVKGCYLKSIEDHNGAIEFFTEFLKQTEKMNVNTTKIEAFQHLGDCYRLIDKHYEAIECYSSGYALAVEGDFGEEQMYCSNQLALSYQKINQVDSALKYHSHFQEKVYQWNRKTNNFCSDYLVNKIQYNQLKEAKEYVEEEHRRVLIGHEAMQNAYKRLDLAVTIGNAIKSNPSYRGLLMLLHSQVSKIMPLSSISLGRYTEETNKVKLAYIIDNQGVQDDIVLDLNRPESFNTKTCIEQRQPVMFRTRLENTSEPLNDYKLQEAYNEIQSALYVPIVLGNKVKGILTVQSKEPHAYSQEDVKVIEIISAYFSQLDFDI